MLVRDRHLERLVDEANSLDTVELHLHPPRCGARFQSWSGEVFCCIEPRGHGQRHQTTGTPDGDVWAWTPARTDNLANVNVETFDAVPRVCPLPLGALAALGDVLDCYCVVPV